MAIEYTWSIPTTEYETATGGITVAHWRVSAVDGDYTASSYGTCGFTPDATDPAFKPYDEVTEAEVLAWVHASVDKDATEAALAAKIEADKNPTSAAGTPWG
jgi:hypothetical protein